MTHEESEALSDSAGRLSARLRLIPGLRLVAVGVVEEKTSPMPAFRVYARGDIHSIRQVPHEHEGRVVYLSQSGRPTPA